MVKTVALNGSSDFPLPFDIQLLNDSNGISLSLPIACNVLGATIIEPNAEEIVAAAKPKGITHHPCQATLDITRVWVSDNSAGLADVASLKQIKI